MELLVLDRNTWNHLIVQKQQQYFIVWKQITSDTFKNEI